MRGRVARMAQGGPHQEAMAISLSDLDCSLQMTKTAMRAPAGCLLRQIRRSPPKRQKTRIAGVSPTGTAQCHCGDRLSNLVWPTISLALHVAAPFDPETTRSVRLRSQSILATYSMEIPKPLFDNPDCAQKCSRRNLNAASGCGGRSTTLICFAMPDIPELSSRACQTRHNGAYRQGRDLRNLAIGKLLEFAQHQDFA